MDRLFLMGDKLVDRKTFVAYLRRCADDWARGVNSAKPQPDEAKRVRQIANDVAAKRR